MRLLKEEEEGEGEAGEEEGGREGWKRRRRREEGAGVKEERRRKEKSRGGELGEEKEKPIKIRCFFFFKFIGQHESLMYESLAIPEGPQGRERREDTGRTEHIV